MITAAFNRLRSFISRGGRDQFLELCAEYGDRLKREPQPVTGAGGDHVAVLITPWLGTAVPLFSLECARMLERSGCRVTLIFDENDVVGNSPDATHSMAIRELLARWEQRDAVVHVGRDTSAPPDYEIAEQLLHSNAIWRMRGEDKASEFLERQPDAREKIARHLGQIEATLASRKFSWILVPGGFFGLSGVYVSVARKLGISFSTYDSAVGVLRLAHDSVAAHLGDLPSAYSALQPHWRENPARRRKVIELARGEIDDRASTKDFRQFQVAPATARDDLKYDLVVPLNIRWDSAALGRQRLFSSVQEWLTGLLSWIGQHPSASICIRQHPRERLDFARSSDRLHPLVEQFSGLGDRLRFVEAAEPLNTYDLLRNARVVLPHTSTVGIEAAMLGKPVVLSANTYYEDFGFCHAPETPDQYFTLIDKAVAGALPISESQMEDAALAYYLTQRCAFVRTDFTANPVDARKWLQRSPDELWSSPELVDFRQALLKREPLSMVRHRRLQDAN